MLKGNKKLKKRILSAMAALLMVVSANGMVYATSQTVYYKGTPVNWEYGRKWGVMSYSEVQSHVYEHCATANNTFSGWQKKGIVAEASQFVGLGTTRAYWDCR